MRKIILLIIILFYSCTSIRDTKKNEEENAYRIISYLIDYLKKDFLPPVAFPPSPKGEIDKSFNRKDSLSSYKYFYNKYKEKKVFAVKKELVMLDHHYFFKHCEYVNSKTFEGYNFSSQVNFLDIDKIFVPNNDSLSFYNKNHINIETKDYKNVFDAVFTFSKIAFNEELNKALLIVSVSQGHLNGFSVLVYLEKEHYHWKVKCEEVLSIS